MATSFAFALLPLEVDDKAPPMDWRTREKMSQGYSRILQSVLPVRGHISRVGTCTLSTYTQAMSQGSKFDSKRKEDSGGTYDENPVIKPW